WSAGLMNVAGSTTMWVTASDVLGAKLVTPAYSARSVCEPLVSVVVRSAAVPAVSIAVPSNVDPSKNATEPVGVALPIVTGAVRIHPVAEVEPMERRQCACRIDLVNRSESGRAAHGGRAVEGAVARLNQRAVRIRPVAVVEAMERGQRPRRIDFENRAVRRGAAI